MKFSLILATLGRKEEVKNYIQSLVNQSYQKFELIIVDQNKDDYVYNLYDEYKKSISIKYIHTDKKGLSRARNLGLKCVTGDIIAFPDDDCEYPSNILEDIHKFLKENGDYNIVTCKSIDKDLRKDSNGKWAQKDIDITYNNVFKTAISYTIFIKTKHINDIIFDERLGVGATYGSGEETDMLLELLHANYNAKYVSTLYVYHPIKEEVIDRVYNYALGKGALLGKEIYFRQNYYYFLKLVFEVFIKPIIGIVLSAATFKKIKLKRYNNLLRGRITGYFDFLESNNQRELLSYLVIFMLVLTSVISPKVIKGIFGESVLWIYPQFILAIILFIITFTRNNFNNKFAKIYKLCYSLAACYTISTVFSMIAFGNYYYKGAVTSIKTILDILLIFIVIVNFNKEQTKYILRSIIYIGIFEIILVIIGIFVWFDALPTLPQFKYYINSVVSQQQWAYLGNLTIRIPKWGGTFPETQALSQYFLACLIVCNCYMKFFISKDSNEYRKYKYLYIIFVIMIIYCFSKTSIIALILFLALTESYNNTIIKKYKKMFIIVLSIIICIFLYLVLYRELNTIRSYGLIEFGINNASSLSDRMFHLIMGIKIMSNSIITLLFGLGPRQYGTHLLLIFGNSRFGVDTSAVSMVQILIDIGVIGLGIFTALSLNIYNSIRKNFILTCEYAVIFISNFTNPEGLPTMFWIFIGMILLIGKNLETEEEGTYV